jgi:hypothetical protein
VIGHEERTHRVTDERDAVLVEVAAVVDAVENGDQVVADVAGEGAVVGAVSSHVKGDDAVAIAGQPPSDRAHADAVARVPVRHHHDRHWFLRVFLRHVDRGRDVVAVRGAEHLDVAAPLGTAQPEHGDHGSENGDDDDNDPPADLPHGRQSRLSRRGLRGNCAANRRAA